MLITAVLLSLCFFGGSVGKVYERCELARELRDVHKLDEKDIATWVCIARHESEFNTSAVGHMNWDGSGDHGLFQISDLYWCSPPGKGYSCGVSCAQLEDDDIKDDVACVKRIHRQHQRISGDGFTAWVVYRAHCSSNVEKYVEGCYDNVPKVDNLDPSNELTKTEVEAVDKKKSEIVNSEELTQKTEKKEGNVVEEGEKRKLEEKTTVASKSSALQSDFAKRERTLVGDEQFKPKSKSTKPFYAKLYEFVYQP